MAVASEVRGLDQRVAFNRGRAFSWALQILAALILAQTLFFKFTGAAESVYIFTTLGLEPWGRIGSGVAELVACVLLLVPRTVVWGAALGLAIICGAITSHLTRLGIAVQGDHGLLFALALAVFGSCVMILFIRRGEVRALWSAVPWRSQATT